MTTERDILEPVRELLLEIASGSIPLHGRHYTAPKGLPASAQAALAALEPAREGDPVALAHDKALGPVFDRAADKVFGEPPPEDVETLRGRALELSEKVMASWGKDDEGWWFEIMAIRDQPTALRALIAALEVLEEVRRGE